MNPRRLPIGVLVIAPIVLGFGLYAFTTQAEEVEEPEATARGTATPDRRGSVEEAYEEYFATEAAPAPTLSADDQYATQTAGQPTTPGTEHGGFHDGAWVRVNAGAGDCLNARNSPSLSSEWVIVNICIPDGYEGLITGNAEQAEGHWWWRLAGMGWVAEEYLVYVREFDLRANVVPELSATVGKIAFLRGNDVWIMDPDGSDQWLAIDNPESSNEKYVPGPTNLAWSPDGTRLSYNTYRYDTEGIDPGTVDLRVLTIDDAGNVSVQVFEGVAGGGWSPDSMHIGVIREPTAPQMGGGMEGIAAILDVTTGGQLVLGSTRSWQTEAPSFNHDGSLLMVHEAIYPADGSASTVAIVIYTADGIVHDRIDFSTDPVGYASPAWAPDGNRIAMYVYRDGRAGYEINDVATRTWAGRAETPETSDRIGGRCGGGDMWNTAWSLDGDRVLYSFMWGDTGANGIWSWDVATGEQRVIYGEAAGAPSAGPGGYVMFSSNSYPTAHIFYGTSDGGFPRFITDGSSPVWWAPE
jgi:Tol biopolymer transport system component